MAYDLGMNREEFNKRMTLLRNFMAHAVEEDMANFRWIGRFSSEDEANKALKDRLDAAFDGQSMLSR